ncbi:hypothetical protein ACV3OC_11730 [Clostridium perfringens]
MKKIITINELDSVDLPMKVKDKIKEILFILDERYEENRDIIDLGGYILLVDEENEIKLFRKNILKYRLPEYTDKIICS